jgi:hypothetical protein
MTSTKTRRRSMTEQAADAAIDQACRSLRLPTMRTQFGPIAAAAERDQLTYRGFLAELLMAECEDRDQRRTVRRIKEAGFPRAVFRGPAWPTRREAKHSRFRNNS